MRQISWEKFIRGVCVQSLSLSESEEKERGREEEALPFYNSYSTCTLGEYATHAACRNVLHFGG